MAQWSTEVEIGGQVVSITTDSFEELIKATSYATDLAREATGVDDATFFYRVVGDDEYMGLVRYRLTEENGWERQEVRFGKLKKPTDPAYKLFAYGKGSDEYEKRGGWRWYNRESEESEPRPRNQKNHKK